MAEVRKVLKFAEMTVVLKKLFNRVPETPANNFDK